MQLVLLAVFTKSHALFGFSLSWLPCYLCKCSVSAAECLKIIVKEQERARKERLKNDPVRYNAYKAKDKDRKKRIKERVECLIRVRTHRMKKIK